MKSAEFRLAAAACRASYGDVSAVSDVTKIDWSRFILLCRRHRIQGLAHAGLRELDAPVPAVASEPLAADARRIAAANLLAIAETGRLLDSFQSADLPILFVKGVSLAALVYPQPLVKMNWDIDLLIDPAALHAAARTLVDLGYRHVVPATGLERWHGLRKESAWTNGVAHIELHTRLADNPAMIPSIDVFSPRQIVTLQGSLPVPTLADDELFAYLCVHGASSAWFRLKWITDLAAMLHGRSTDDIHRLFDR